LSLYVSNHPESRKMSVTLKINSTDISAIIQTFNRYNYTISASYMTSKDLDEFYQDRFDEFLNYLNV